MIVVVAGMMIEVVTHVMSRISGAMYLLVPTLGFCGMFVSPVAWKFGMRSGFRTGV